MSRHHPALACLLLGALGLAGCGGDETPDASLPADGNVVVGRDDAGPTPDAGVPEDGGNADGGDPRVDAGPGPDGGGSDAGVDDGGTPDAGDPCLEAPEAELSVDDVLADSTTWDGRLITVVGTATRTPYMCTSLPCPPENPCCNTCTAEVRLDGRVPLAPNACLDTVGCSGTECAQVCAPPLLGVAERFTGRWRDGPEPALELFRSAP